jgi:hypothetical protein
METTLDCVSRHDQLIQPGAAIRSDFPRFYIFIIIANSGRSGFRGGDAQAVTNNP